MGTLKSKSALMIFDRHANLKYKYGNRNFWCTTFHGNSSFFCDPHYTKAAAGMRQPADCKGKENFQREG